MNARKTTNPRELTAKELKTVVGGGGGLKEILGGPRKVRRARQIPKFGPKHM
jgi:bacteriocin-like protein